MIAYAKQSEVGGEQPRRLIAVIPRRNPFEIPARRAALIALVRTANYLEVQLDVLCKPGV
jgi:hypothetical protein